MSKELHTGEKWIWVRTGICCMCGDCCNRNNFYGNQEDNPDIQLDPDGYCRWLDKKTRKCMIQKTKPLTCIRFPMHPAEIYSLPNCTYRFHKEYLRDD